MYDALGTIDWAAVAFEEPAPVRLKTRPFRSIDEVKQRVAKRYRITVADLESSSKEWRFAHPRQVAMAIAYRRLKPFGYSLPMIGKHFGGRDHTTVLFAVRKLGTKGKQRNAPSGAKPIRRSELDRRAAQ